MKGTVKTMKNKKNRVDSIKQENEIARNRKMKKTESTKKSLCLLLSLLLLSTMTQFGALDAAETAEGETVSQIQQETVSSSSESDQIVSRQVASNTLTLYGNSTLMGGAIGQYTRGEVLSVLLSDDGVATVYNGSNIMGYCASKDLAETGSLLFTMAPYRFESAGEVTLVSDLIDLDLYLYETDSLLTNAGSSTVLIQQDTLLKLETAASLITARFGSQYNLRVVSAYLPSNEDPDCEAPSNTGTLVQISLYYLGAEVEISSLSNIDRLFQQAGLSASEWDESYYYDQEYAQYLGVDYDVSELPVFILK
jgi:hypothetical protein